MGQLKISTYDIHYAKFYLNKHKDSKNETIKKSTDAMLDTLDLLSKNYQDTIEYLEKLYSPESMENPNAGKMMSDVNKRVSGREELLKIYSEASIMSTSALVSDKEDKEGHAGYLTITSEERDALKKELIDCFGVKKAGKFSVQHFPVWPASAIYIYEFLKRDFTPMDKK